MSHKVENYLLANLWKYEEITSISDWASSHVDLSLVPNYETPIHGKWDSTFCPFWIEPLDSLIDPACREVVLWKPSRAGATEGIALNAIRYHIYQDPIPILFLGAQQESVERFFQERIVLGLDAVDLGNKDPLQSPVDGQSDPLHNLASPQFAPTTAYAAPSVAPRKIIGTRLYQGGATLTASYPASKSSDKMFGYQLAIIDEASLCPSGTVDTLRKRLDTYRFAHLLILSSMDARQTIPSKDDAIFIEWNGGDKREWFINDGTQDFILKSGSDKTPWGLKWDDKAKNKDGEWNLQRVFETAHYITPSGKIWNTSDKNKAVKKGYWKPTNESPTDKRKRSYRLDSLNLPFINGDLGHYATEFLKAQSQGAEKLRIFIYENKCEPWTEKAVVNIESSIKLNVGKYLHQNKPSVATEYKDRYALKDKVTLLTADIHDEGRGFVYAVREWVTGGDSGLVDFGSVKTWQDIKNLQLKYDCKKIFVDGSYKTEEVQQTLITPQFHNQSVICMGRAQLKTLFETKFVDPYEGSITAGKYKLASITHNPDKIKNELHRLINQATGKLWLLPMGVDLDAYIKQLQSESCINGKWVQTNANNHYWDVEVLQLLGAIALGIYQFGIKDDFVLPSEKEQDIKVNPINPINPPSPSNPPNLPNPPRPKRQMATYG